MFRRWLNFLTVALLFVVVRVGYVEAIHMDIDGLSFEQIIGASIKQDAFDRTYRERLNNARIDQVTSGYLRNMLPRLVVSFELNAIKNLSPAYSLSMSSRTILDNYYSCRMAKIDADVCQIRMQQSENDIAYQCGLSYIQYVSLQRQLELWKQYMTTLEEIVSTYGLTSSLEIELLNVRIECNRLSGELDAEKRLLAKYVGIEPDILLLECQYPFDISQGIMWSKDEYVALARENDLDGRITDLEREKNDIAFTKERWGRLPDITLSLFAQHGDIQTRIMASWDFDIAGFLRGTVNISTQQDLTLSLTNVIGATPLQLGVESEKQQENRDWTHIRTLDKEYLAMTLIAEKFELECLVIELLERQLDIVTNQHTVADSLAQIRNIVQARTRAVLYERDYNALVLKMVIGTGNPAQRRDSDT